MTAATCSCGAPLVRRPVAHLCGPGMPGPIYGDPECSDPEHRAELAEEAADAQRRARAARDETALLAAIESGLIVREHPPGYDDRWAEE